jgi:uncharacterized membrane protein YfcA
MDLPNDNLLFEREVLRIANENDRSGFRVERRDNLLTLIFGYRLDNHRQTGLLTGLALTACGGLAMFYGAPVLVAAVALGAGLNSSMYAASTPRFNQEQLVKEAGKGVLTGLASTAVSAVAAARLAAYIPNPFAAQAVSQAGASALCNGIQQNFEKEPFSYSKLVISAVAGSAGAVCGAGAGVKVTHYMGSAGSEMLKAAVARGCEGATNAFVSCGTSNWLNKKELSEGLLESTLIGGSIGALAGAAQTKKAITNTGFADQEHIDQEAQKLSSQKSTLDQRREGLKQTESQVITKENNYQAAVAENEAKINREIAQGFKDDAKGRRDNPNQAARDLTEGNKVTLTCKFEGGKLKIKHTNSNPLKNPSGERQALDAQKTALNNDIQNHQRAQGQLQAKIAQFDNLSMEHRSLLSQTTFPVAFSQDPVARAMDARNAAYGPQGSPPADPVLAIREDKLSINGERIQRLSSQIDKTQSRIKSLEEQKGLYRKAGRGRKQRGKLNEQISREQKGLDELENEKKKLVKFEARSSRQNSLMDKGKEEIN